MKKEAPTTALRMSESRDYWQQRAMAAEHELKIAAKCVRDLLKTRKNAEGWLRLFEQGIIGEKKERSKIT